MPQPIDPNTELGRVTAAERIQQVADRASLAAQARQAQETERQRAGIEQHVLEAEAKKNEVDREQKRRNPFVGQRKRRSKDEPSDGRKRTVYTAAERLEELDDDAHDLDLRV